MAQGYTGHTSSSGKARSGTATGRSNPGAKPAITKGTPAVGNGQPLANLPAKNKGTFPVKMGSGMKGSQLAKSQTVSATESSTGSNTTSPTAGRPNMPANNTTNKSVPMGTTHHKVGQAPSYLRNPNNSASK